MSGKTLVVYLFHEYNSRVECFFKNCIFEDEFVDFMVVCNNPNINFIVPAYVKVMKRNNIGYDFGGWSDALLTDELYKKYDTFIMANSSIVGPYLPLYYRGKWTDIFVDGLRENVKLFGTTINRKPFRNHKLVHVQSFLFSMNKETLEFLIKKEIFTQSKYTQTMDATIREKEIGMSSVLLEHGWNIGCLMPLYNGVDFTKFPDEGLPDINDIAWENQFCKYWSPESVVFIKGNRVNLPMPENWLV